MNPLTLVKRIQSINAKEADLGISDQASWHAKYKDSAYVFVGGIPYDLTEGDLLAVFAQYGEIVDVNLVRDKATGKSKGFAFIAYEDQRSTILAVDNLNGAQIAGRIIRVDHVSNYKKKEEEDEETERQKREERGVCRAFQRGECKYGDSCRFSHDEQRAANTGWGPEEDRKSRWTHDKFDNCSGANKRTDDAPPSHAPKGNRADDYDRKGSRGKDNTEIDHRQIAADLDLERRDRGRRPEYEEGRGKQTVDRRSSRYEPESKSRDDYDGREEKRSRRYETESNARDNQEEKDRDRDGVREKERERDKGSSHPRDSSPPCRDRKDDDHHRDRRDDDHRRDRRDDDYRRDRKDDDQRKDKRGDDHRRGRHDDDYHRSRR